MLLFFIFGCFETCLAESLAQPLQFQGGLAGTDSGSLVATLALEHSIGQKSLARLRNLFQQLFNHRFAILS